MKQTTTQGAILAIAAVTIVGATAAALFSRRSMPEMKPERDGAAAPVSGAVAADKVSIMSFAFGPQAVTVKAGTTVTWTNQDNVEHTVTSDSGGELSSDPFIRGGTYSHTFAKAGTYAYHCVPHPYMKGTVIVTP